MSPYIRGKSAESLNVCFESAQLIHLTTQAKAARAWLSRSSGAFWCDTALPQYSATLDNGGAEAAANTTDIHASVMVSFTPDGNRRQMEQKESL